MEVTNEEGLFKLYIINNYKNIAVLLGNQVFEIRNNTNLL